MVCFGWKRPARQCRTRPYAGRSRCSALSDDTHEVINQAYCTGNKESERRIVRQLLNDTDLHGQKLTMDAWHLIPLTINAIHLAKGIYVVGSTLNQTHLYRYCLCHSLAKWPIYGRVDGFEGGHGRLEHRIYSCFSYWVQMVGGMIRVWLRLLV